jgi:choline kinase
MGELCKNKPKCLLSLDGRSLLAWQLDALQTAGIQSTSLVAGYHKQQLSGYTDHLIENRCWPHSSIFTSLACAAEQLRLEPCVISYSDIVYHPDHVVALIQANAPISITADLAWLDLWRQRFQRVCTDAESFRYLGNRLLEIGQRVTDASLIQGQFMGLLKITPEGWEMIEKVISGLQKSVIERLDITALLQLLLQHAVPVAVIPVKGRWCELDSEIDFNLYTRLLQNERTWLHDWRWS